MGKNEFSAAVIDHVMENDLFSQWLGIQIIEIREGYSKIKMTIRGEMMNGLGDYDRDSCWHMVTTFRKL